MFAWVIQHNSLWEVGGGGVGERLMEMNVNNKLPSIFMVHSIHA